VILVDVNILLYASNAEADQNAESRDWLGWVARPRLDYHGRPCWRFCGSRRTQERFAAPRPWRPRGIRCRRGSLETVWTPEPTERHGAVLGNLLALPGVYGNLVPDAHLAALAIEHGLTLCSTDGDFARFPGLTWLNPLSA
jgi:predicted nucleic acid-binding protein